MDFFIFFIFFFVILIPIVLGYIIPIYKEHNTTTKGVINYDSVMRKFVYKVYLTKDEIINRLNEHNDIDELSCSFDFEKSVIKISEYGSDRKYYFNIKEYNEYSILMLEDVAIIGMQSYVPLKLNPFMVSKLQAEIIPFSQYKF